MAINRSHRLKRLALPLAGAVAALCLASAAAGETVTSKLQSLLPKMPAVVTNALPTGAPPAETKEAPPAPNTPPAANAPAGKPVLEQSAQLPDWRGSVMFSLQDMEKVHQMLEAFQNNTSIQIQGEGGDEDFLSAISGEAGAANQPPPYQFPIFYLSSIVYASGNEWAVWVNGQKIDASGKFKAPQLSVSSLSKNHATLTWSPGPRDLTELRKNWTKKMSMPTQGDWKLSPAIQYSQTDDKIVFTLKPNQHFSTKTMEIVEGRAPLPVAPATQPAAPAPREETR